MFHEFSTTTTDMAVLQCVLGCRPLRHTIQVRFGTNPAVSRVPRDCPVARPPRLACMAGRHAHVRALITPIHQTSGLENSGLWSPRLATADADQVQTRKPKQDTGGSDALWKLPRPQGSHGINGQKATIQANPG
jgi:hypothetical protein